MEFEWDGTRWLSVHLYVVPIPPEVAMPLTATAADATRILMPNNVGSDIWIEDHMVGFFVVGGSALGATHKWTGSVRKSNIDAGTVTVIATPAIDSGASSVFRRLAPTAIDALLGTNVTVSTSWTKVNTPGNLYVWEALSYRIVAT